VIYVNAINVDCGDICMANIDDYTTLHWIMNTKHNADPNPNGEHDLINFIS